MSVLVNILTTYNGAGTKRAIRDLSLMQKQAALAGRGVTAGMMGASIGMQRAGASMARSGAAMSKYITLPVVAIGAASVITAAKFDASMKLIQTQASGSAKDVAILSQQVLELGTKGQHGPMELSAALYHLKSVGMDNKAAMDALTQSERLASVGHADLEATTNAVAGAYKSGIKGAQNFGQTVGTLNAIIGAGNLRMEDLNSALGTGFLVTAQTFGVSLTSVGAALAMMTSRGIPATRAATALKMTFTGIAAPSAKAEKAFAKVGLKARDLAVAMREKGLGGALDMLKAKLAGLSKTDQSIALTKMFGARSSQAILTLLGNLKDYDRTVTQVSKNSSKFDELAAAQAKDADAKWNHFKSTMQTAGIEIGNVLLPFAMSLADALGGVGKWLTKLSPSTRKWVVGLALVAAAGGPVLLMVGKLTSGIGRMVGVVSSLSLAFGKGGGAAPAWARGIDKISRGLATFVKQGVLGIGMLVKQAAAWVVETAAKVASTAATIAQSAATKASAAAQWLLNAAMTANPIGLIIVGIAALAAGFVLLWTKCKWFRNFWVGLWNGIKSTAARVWTWMVSAFRKYGQWILLALTGPIGLLVVYLAKHWRQIKDGAVTAFNAVVSFVRGIPGKIRSAVGNLGKLLYGAGRTVVTGLWNGIASMSSWIWDKVTGFAKGVFDAVKNGLGKLWPFSPSQAGVDIGYYLGKGIEVGINKSESAVRGAVAKMSSWLTIATAGATLPAFGTPAVYGGPGGAYGRSAVIHVAPGAVQIAFGGSGSNGPSRVDLQATIDRAFRKLAAEIGRR
jgi:TP901 family phage tail tape measure protein